MADCANPIPSHAIESDAVIEKLRSAVQADNIRIIDESLQHMRQKTKEKMMKWKKVGMFELQELFTVASESAAVMKKLEKETKIKKELEKILDEEELALVQLRPETKLKRYLEKIEKQQQEEKIKQAERIENIRNEEKEKALKVSQEANDAKQAQQLKESKVENEINKIKDEYKSKEQVKEPINEKKDDASKDTKGIKVERQDQNISKAQSSQSTSITNTTSSNLPLFKPNNTEQQSQQTNLFTNDSNKQQTAGLFTTSANPFPNTSSSPLFGLSGNSNSTSTANDNKFAVKKELVVDSSKYFENTKKNPMLDGVNPKDIPPLSTFSNTNAQKSKNQPAASGNLWTQKSGSNLNSLSNTSSLFGSISPPDKSKESIFLSSLSNNKPTSIFGLPQQPNPFINASNTQSSNPFLKAAQTNSTFSPPSPNPTS